MLSHAKWISAQWTSLDRRRLAGYIQLLAWPFTVLRRQLLRTRQVQVRNSRCSTNRLMRALLKNVLDRNTDRWPHFPESQRRAKSVRQTNVRHQQYLHALNYWSKMTCNLRAFGSRIHGVLTHDLTKVCLTWIMISARCCPIPYIRWLTDTTRFHYQLPISPLTPMPPWSPNTVAERVCACCPGGAYPGWEGGEVCLSCMHSIYSDTDIDWLIVVVINIIKFLYEVHKNKKLCYGRGLRNALVSIEKSFQSMNDLDVHPRSSQLLLLNGCISLPVCGLCFNISI